MNRPPASLQGLMPSLLDRLIDPDSMGAGATRGYTVEQMRDAVRRDLEALFNTHDPGSRVPEAFTEVRNSVVTYGLPDITWASTIAGYQPADLARIIEQAINRHEPRLRDLRVVVTKDDPKADSAHHQVCLHVEARLNVDPSPEVEFETILELSTGHASIRSTGG